MPVIKSFIAQTKRQKIFEKYFYIKLFWGRSDSYFSIPVNLAAQFGVVSIWFKLFGFNQVTLIFIAIGYVIFRFTLGYIDVKNCIINEENSFNNRYSPELQNLISNIKKGE